MEIAERRASQCNLDLSKYLSSLIIKDDSEEKIKELVESLIPAPAPVEPSRLTDHIPIREDAKKRYEELLEAKKYPIGLIPVDICKKRGHEWIVASEDESGNVTYANCKNCGEPWMY